MGTCHCDGPVVATLRVATRPLLVFGVRPGAPHRARHAGAALRSFMTSTVVPDLDLVDGVVAAAI